jgi:TP901-1 family phage major tail protein
MANELLSKTASITYGGVAIAKLTGWSLEINKETVDITNLDSAGWKEFLVDLKDWSISFDGIVTRTGTGDYEELLQDMIATDTAVAVTIVDSDATVTTTISGSGYITSLPLTGAVGDKQTFSGSIQGTGALSVA